MSDILFESERYYLRKFTLSDVDDMFSLDSDPEVHTYLGKNPITEKRQAQEIVQNILDQYEQNGLGRLVIIDKQSEAFIGWSGLKWETGIREYGYYDLGYRLKQKYWGQGIATETGRASLRFGFEKLNLKEIYAGADINNAGSNNVLQKLNFTLLETFDFEEIPHHWYGISAKEWQLKISNQKG